ncbi:MAG: hypothetical protein AB202_02775 [Parcubacteria bacterium C7867-007]|nr:MAG: hypothetical protein AB202_02775 [Parcubacteria bacterium C7867-007]
MTQSAQVLLVPSHHTFNHGHATTLDELTARGSTTLSEEMLGWPLFLAPIYPYRAVSAETDQCYKRTLTALMQFAPFTTVVSLGVQTSERGFLYLDRYTWGMIFLEGRRVASFTHDTTKESHPPFICMEDWAEGGDREKINTWSAEMWGTFFRVYINRICEREIAAARKVVACAEADIAFHKLVAEAVPA